MLQAYLAADRQQQQYGLVHGCHAVEAVLGSAAAGKGGQGVLLA